MSRRALLGAFALVGIGGATARDRDQSLGAIAKHAGIRFGSAIRASSLQDQPIASLVAAQCTSITPELEMKWAALAPSADTRDTGDADAIVAWARSHKLAVRGHALLWHRSMPSWVNADTPWDVVAAHIRATVKRFGGAVDEWDVVNEPIARDGAGLRPSPFTAAPDYIARALHDARAVAPKARLVINDYHLEDATPEQDARREALLDLVRTLRRDGVPLDGIGIQAHLRVGRPFEARPFANFLDSIRDLGLSVSITELDIKERDYTLPAAARDAAVAERVARFLETALASPAVQSLTCWGLSDRQSWLEITPEDRARFPGAWADGTSPGLNRGLPYDSDAAPKPMRDAIARALSGRASSDIYLRPAPLAHGGYAQPADDAPRPGHDGGHGHGAGAR